MRIEGFMVLCLKILQSYVTSCFYVCYEHFDMNFSFFVMPFYLGFLFLPAHACIRIGRDTV